jgi:hypothetical protein
MGLFSSNAGEFKKMNKRRAIEMAGNKPTKPTKPTGNG